MILWVIFAILMFGESTDQLHTEALPQEIACAPCNCTKTADEDIHADCSKKHLDTIPSSIPSGVTHLIMANNVVTNLSADDLHQFSQLRYLDLSKNKINILHADGFKGAVALLWLNLHGNQLTLNKTTYPKGLFQDQTKLAVLDLSGNTLVKKSSYPDESLGDLVSLHTLVVDGIENCTFGEGFARLTNLTTLTISGRRGYCSIFGLLNESFIHTPHLRILDISKCKITLIDVGSFLPLRNIDTLDVSENELGFKTFGDSMFGLINSSLRVIKLNRITSTYAIGIQIQLTHVRFFNEMQVKEIYLDCNSIENIENIALHAFTSVEVISMKGNEFRPGSYMLATDQLVNLRKLFINNPYAISGPLPEFATNSDSCISTEHDNDKVFNFYPEKKIYMDTVQRLQRRQTRSSVHRKDHTRKRMLVQRNFNGIPTNMVISRPKVKRLSSHQNRTSRPTLKEKEEFIQYSINIKIPIAPNATFVNASNRYIRSKIGKMSFLRNQIQTIDLSNNILTKWEGPVLQAQNIKFLDLSNNFCKFIAPTFLKHASGLQILNISQNYLAESLENDTMGEIFINQIFLEIFRISNNFIYHLPPLIFASLEKLKVLDLSWNMMSSWVVNIRQMTHLYLLDLSNNRFESVPKSLRKQIDEIMIVRIDTFHVSMKGNSLKCTCDTLEDMWWMLEPYVVVEEESDTQCTLSDGTMVSLDNLNNLVLELHERCKTVIPLIFGATTGLILFVSVLVGGIIYRYRWKLRYLYYTTRRKYRGYQRQLGEEDNFRYDAFVSYEYDDREFVVQDMRNILEQRFGLRLCIHQRDFMVGEPITANIVNAIQSSRKTIILLTPSFLASSWCDYEVHMAKLESIHTGRDILCVVWLIDIPDTSKISRDVLDEIEHGTYIQYPADEIDKEEFWQKMKAAISF
ncbi:toll-like receptor 4 [Haliotis cracherodii]|uniref:toll-like receptor 4 n=1 Tax=Haliotis cracherodii TaxID=6455 RepID=UPI0039E86386